MKDTLASYGRSHLEASFSFEGAKATSIMFFENCTQKKKEKPLLKAKAGEET
nr:hypothetical protein [uncultured Anaeromusa sp.]